MTAPLLFTWISGYAIGVGGFLALGGLAVTAPILGPEWARIRASGEALSLAEAERLAAAPSRSLRRERSPVR